jgi:hypothetical protein
MFFRRDGQTIIEASMRNGLYIVTHVADGYEETAFNAFPATEQEEAEVETVGIPRVKKLTPKQETNYYLWHRRMNHLNPEKIRNLHKVTTLSSPIKVPSDIDICEICCLTKMTNRLPKKLAKHKDRKLALIQFDVAGPLPISARKNRYFLLIIDSYTRENWVICLQSRDGAILALKAWKKDVEFQTKLKILAARTDNAPELLKAIDGWRDAGSGVRKEQTTAATSHQNGPAERNIRTAEADARAMLKEAGLPIEFWDEAVEYDAYVRNRTDTGPVIDGSVVSPHEAYTGETPSIDHLRVWGYRAFAYINPKTIPANQRHDKLIDTARVGVFMGFSENTMKQVKIYCPDLGYTQRFSRFVIDEKTRGGEVSLHLRTASGPQGTPTELPDRLPRGRPKKGKPMESEALEKSKTVPQVILPSFRQPPGMTYRYYNDGDLPEEPEVEAVDTQAEPTPPPAEAEDEELEPADNGKEKSDNVTPVEPQLTRATTGKTSAPERITLDTRAKRHKSDNTAQQTDDSGIPDVLAMDDKDDMDVDSDNDIQPRYFTRSTFKRKRSDSETVTDRRARKIIRAMIAQIALGEMDDEIADIAIEDVTDFDDAAFPAKEVLGIKIPATYKEAVNDPEYGQLWKQAIIEELNSLMDNGTWEQVVPPKDANIISCKWVFDIKKLTSGAIERFKARLVARGFSQVMGVDYHDTFAPTVRMETLRLFFAMVARKNLECSHFDIKNAFTESHLKEKILMDPPPGLKVKKGMVLKVLRSLYGLKQAARDWNQLIKKELLSWGFVQSLADPCMFTHKENSLVLLVYVDDIAAAAKTQGEIDWFWAQLSKRFKAKPLGEISKILGVRVVRDRANRTIYLDQQQYLRSILDKFGFHEPPHTSKCHPSANYEDYSPSTDDDTRIDPSQYQQIVGSLMFAMILTRPDIAFSLGKLSQHMSDPCERHGKALKKLMRYLNFTTSQKLRFGPSGAHRGFVVYSDADWAGDKIDRKSVSGFVIMFYGGPISWGSKKQKSVATSSCESEYMALAMCAKQGQWIAQIFRDLGLAEYIGKNLTTVQMLGDNQGSIALVENPHLHERSKHIDIAYHFIRDLAEQRKLQIDYIPTQDMVADGMTKPLQKPGFMRFKELLGVVE